MDISSSRGRRNIPKFDDTAYHYSPAHGPEDVVCGGSDTEETQDEIRKKRQRYEDQAKRYLDGHRPVLHSASLRGPFNKESGWVNPWRYQAPKTLDWWRPGGKEMLFTKSNVLKRAADHGLEHLSPAAALSWCKSTAEAEAGLGAENGTPDLESVSSSMEDDEEEYQWHSEHGDASPEEDTATPEALKNDVAEDGTGRNTYTNQVTQGIKRPVNSSWLKGSYVSKRARWDGPTISTPTPIPDIHGRRRQQTQTRLVDIEKAQQLSVSALDRFPQAVSQGSFTVRRTGQNSIQTRDRMSSPSLKQRDSSVRTSLTPAAQRAAREMSGSPGQLHEASDIDDFQETSTMRFESHSRQESQKGVNLSRPYTNPESRLSVTESISHPKRHEQAPNTDRKSPEALSSLGFSDTAPRRLPDDGRALIKRQESVSSEEEISFVTEVAPSSRNLEEFQYRKKRTKVQHSTAADSLNHDTRASIIASMMEEAPKAHGHQADPKAYEMDKLVVSPQAKDEVNTRSPDPNSSSLSRSDFASYYDERYTSPLQTPHVPRLLNNPPLLPELATFASPFFQGGLGIESGEPGTISPKPKQTSYPVPRPSQVLPSQTLPRLPIATLKSPVFVHTSHGNSKATRQCDSSTQSYNTTPIRSARSAASSQVPEIQNQVSGEEVASIPLEESLVLVDSDLPTGKIGNHLDVDHPEKLNEDVLGGAILNQQALNQELQSQPVLNSQLQSESALLIDPSADAPSFEEVRTDEFIVKEVPHDRNNKDNSSVPCQEDVVENGTYRERALGNETDGESLESQQNLHLDNDLHSHSNQRSAESPSVNSPQNDHGIPASDANQKEAPPPVHGSLDPSSDYSTQTNGEDSETMVPALPTIDSPQTPIVASQVLGPEEQSPWASVKIEPVSRSFVMVRDRLDEDDAASASSYDDIILQLDDDDPADLDVRADESSWQHIESSPTPDGEVITPFKNILVPPSPASRSHTPEDLPSTQLLLEAALKNPWDSNSKPRGSEKSRKRVSFGILPFDCKRGKEKNLAESAPVPKPLPRSPPPQEPTEQFDEDSSDDTTMVVSFGDHSSTTERHRLITERDSQLNSSPAVVAQAQAFIAADREVSERQEDHKNLPTEPARQLQSRDEAMENSVWQDSVRAQDSFAFEDSSFLCSKSPSDPFAAPTFDMEDVLGKAGDFLEDWSVDAEIKKAREVDLRTNIESNSAKRRKLFGIV